MRNYRKPVYTTTSIECNDSVEGETIEQKIERVVNNQEPIEDGAPIIFTERKDGVVAGYNPRTDRFDVAIDAMDNVSASHRAKRLSAIEEREKGKAEGKVDGGQSTDGTSQGEKTD